MKLRKGFTLVELLIVIVIIGILAAAMMLASGSATDQAEGTAIISDLRNIASASLIWFIENQDTFNAGTMPALADLSTFMSNPERVTVAAGYQLDVNTATGEWWAGFTNPNRLTEGVARRLAGRAQSVGLYSANGAGVFTLADRGTGVWFRAR